MTTATKPRWVGILDGFAAVHGTNLTWVCKQVGWSATLLSRARSGEPGRHVPERHQRSIADLFQVPRAIIFGPWDHWPFDGPIGRLRSVMVRRGGAVSVFKRSLRRCESVPDDRVGDIAALSVNDWPDVLRAATSRLLWVPEGAIWHDGGGDA